MPFVFRWFALFAAGWNLLQLYLILRRPPPPGITPTMARLGRGIALANSGGMASAFLVLAGCQMAGSFATPFFVLAPLGTSPYILPARLAMYGYWGVALWALSRPGAAEAAVAMGYVRASWPASPQQLRLLFTLTIVGVATGFTLAPLWVPPDVVLGVPSSGQAP